MASSYPIKNKNGVVYAYRVRVYRGRDVDGKQLKPYSTVWKIPDGMKNSRTIKKELDRFSVLFEQQCKEGMVSTDRKTFAAYSEYYLALKERDQKQKTVDSYRDLLVRINEEIGFLKLSDVNCEHLNRFYIKLAQKGQNKKTGEGLSPKTIVEHHRLIHSIFTQAMKEGLVKFNPAETASPPSVKKKEASFFEAEDVERIMKCLEQEPLKWRCITLLMIATGARRGEIMGLKWSAIDFKKDEIKICANLFPWDPDLQKCRFYAEHHHAGGFFHDHVSSRSRGQWRRLYPHFRPVARGIGQTVLFQDRRPAERAGHFPLLPCGRQVQGGGNAACVYPRHGRRRAENRIICHTILAIRKYTFLSWTEKCIFSIIKLNKCLIRKK